MDQNLKDKILSLPRAKQLSKVLDENIPLHKIKEQFGGPDLSDEEFLLRYIMKGNQEIDAMRKAGPRKKYFSGTSPLIQVLDHLNKQPEISHVQIQSKKGSLVLANV